MPTFVKYLAGFVLWLFCILYAKDTRLLPINGDPYNYLHAAQTLRAGHGLRMTDDTPYTIWPPLYPIALAVLGGDLNAARAINVMGLWAALLLSYALMRRYDVPMPVAVGTCLAFVLWISDAQITFQAAASETLFLPLWLGWIYTLSDIDTREGLMLNSLLISGAALTRYIGVPFIALGALYIYGRQGLKAALAWAAAPCLLCGLWMLRNWRYVGRLTGHSAAGDYTGESVWQMLGVLNQWGMLVIALSGGFFCLVYFSARWSSRTVRSSSSVDTIR